ncbi:MAG: FG-GAP repeat protein, partial [Bacteroidetes bacterium]|nr:FG-GAP repeat protein [Bacteroidota bacterium]
GHVRAYQRDTINTTIAPIGWSQISVDIDGEAAGDQSGISVSLSSDSDGNNTLAIGAYNNDGNGADAGHVRIYNFSIPGCTDSAACNYYTLATIDDGSCVFPVVIWQQPFSICDGESIIVGSSIYNTPGVYTDTLSTSNGCDSIVHTNISIIPHVIWTQAFSICDGDSVTVGSSIYNTTGNYTDTLTTSNGCDSVVTTNLTIEQNTTSYDTLSVTASIVWNGLPLSVSGDYSVTLTNSAGCDSIANLNLTVITTTGISDIANNKSKLVKIIDMLGQETPYRKNTPLFYIYDDGTVEKKIIIE